MRALLARSHPSRPARVVPGSAGLPAGPVDRSDRRRGLQLLLGILLFVAAQFVMATVARVATEASGASLAEGPAPWVSLLAAGVGVGAGVVEEVVFRGILLRLIDAWLGSWAALALTSLLFGLVHLMNPGATVLTAFGLVIEAGVLLGAAYLLTRRLWLVIGIHIAWNTVQAGVFSSAVSGTGRQSGLLIAEAQGPTWLNGGTMGIEGSLVSVLLGLVVGLAMLVLAARRGHLLPSVRAERRDDALQVPRDERVTG